ncbi:MAG: hydantoinase/oxoprolinase family protein [Gammaproteobacteria bacterium]|nr:hydantoinase/oxoprolinase family protein [Gammaproteobacteria bacterium]
MSGAEQDPAARDAKASVASSRAGLSLGVDIGGTFTDVVAFDHASGAQHSCKVLTTHDDPSRAVIAGLDRLSKAQALDPGRFTRIVHATTLFTNALIERRGARTALITSAGFRDVLEIGRERKYELYDIAIRKPEPLVPRDLRFEVDERMLSDGSVHRALDLDELRALAATLHERGVESLAVVFLHAHVNPSHEREALSCLAAVSPQLYLTASHEVAPEVREYERTSTAVANAYVKPLAARYLDNLSAQLRARGLRAELALMMSSGGLTHVAQAKRAPVQLLESGPAAGALAAAFFGSADAHGRLLAFDMGGTTAKLSLIDDGEPLTAHAFEAARQKRFIEHSGLPIRISTIELIEIGAGGGSIAQLDALGLVKVGPQSAGSEPGPAAYGRGGRLATVTDADFALGYLNPEFFAGGSLAIDMPAMRTALAALAEQAGMQPDALAWGVHDIVNENMASAARVHIAERGRDPGDYTLMCTGGAGPVHAFYLARKLGIRRILCPPSAGVASALGLLIAPARVDRVASVDFDLGSGSLSALEQCFARLEQEARAVLAEANLDADRARVQRAADGRFRGQGFELAVTLPDGPYDQGDAQTSRAALQAAYEQAYRQKYARTPPEVPVELVNARVSLRLDIEGAGPVDASSLGAETAMSEVQPVGRRLAWFPELREFRPTAVYRRETLGRGASAEGPAIIEDEGSTLVVGPDARFTVLDSGNLLVQMQR